MHLSRVDLNLFVVFDAIYSEGGLTRAGRRLNLSQPAVSHALARLRAMFDDPLFTRRGHVMAPTPQARRMIDPVRKALAELDATIGHTDRFDPATIRTRFVVGIREVLEPIILAPFMQRLLQAAPHIDIAVVRAERRDLERELATGALDAAIDVLLALPEEVCRRRLGPDRLTVMARRGHPRVRRKLDLDTYLAQEHIQVSARRQGLSAEDFELSRKSLARRVRLRCRSYLAACQVVAESDLILTLTDKIARTMNLQFGHRLMPFPLEAPHLGTYLYWHVHTDADGANTWLRKQLGEAFDEGTRRSQGGRGS